MERHFILIAFLLTNVVSFSQSANNKMYIILLAGQSNMAGRGSISQLTPADTVTYSNIYSLNKDSVWVRAKHPLHWDKAEASVGMGIAFAHKLDSLMGGNIKIGLVPCASGGTSINQWLSNSYFGNTGDYFLYSNLISRAKLAQNYGQIIGMIWHQGESDSNGSSYSTYQNRLQTFFKRVRTDLGLPNMPIVAGELGRYLGTNPDYPRCDSINLSINRLKKKISHYNVATSEGLSSNKDNTHFNTASVITYGKRYAPLFYDLVIKDTISKLKSIAFVLPSVQIYAGSKKRLKVIYAPINTAAKVLTWTTSDVAIATVSNGIITGKVAGKVKITATSDKGLSISCNVTVL